MNDKGLWWWWLLVRRYSYCRCRRRRAAATDRCLSKIFFSFCVVSSRSGRMFLAHAENMYSSIAYIHLNRVHRASHAATLQRTTNDHVARSKPVSFRRDVRQKHPNNRLEEIFRIQCINYSNFKYKINIMYLKKYLKSIENRKSKILKVFGNHCETENLAKSVARNGCVFFIVVVVHPPLLLCVLTGGFLFCIRFLLFAFIHV